MAIPQTPLLLREPESFVHALLGAQDMAALAKMMGGMTTLEEVVGNTAPDRF